jgi:hypothetical protein
MIGVQNGVSPPSFDARTESMTNTEKANALRKRSYLSPWVVPERV